MAQRSHPRPARRRGSAARRLAGVPVALGVAAALAGCSVTNAATTLFNYDASDGVSVIVGDVEAGALLVLTSELGAPGDMIGYVSNRGADPVRVTIGLAGGPAGGETFTVRPGATVLLGPEAEESVLIDSVPEIPGAAVDVVVGTDAGGSAVVQVPVMDGTLEEYAPYVDSVDL